MPAEIQVSPATVIGLADHPRYSLYDTVVVFDKVRENTAACSRPGTTYSQAATSRLNQTLVSPHTSLIALLPVARSLPSASSAGQRRAEGPGRSCSS